MVAIVPQNLTEFWNVCTRPSDRNGLGLTPTETDKHISQLESLLTVHPEVPNIYTEWRRFVVTHYVSGVRVYDARVVASMETVKLSAAHTAESVSTCGPMSLPPGQFLSIHKGGGAPCRGSSKRWHDSHRASTL